MTRAIFLALFSLLGLLAPASALSPAAENIVLTENIPPVFQWNFVQKASLPASITETRASSADYYNSSGVLSSAGNNTARFDYNPSAPMLQGVLNEVAATNLLEYSGPMTNAYWTCANCTTAAGAVVAPDGATNMLVVTATNAANRARNGTAATVVSGQLYVCSVYASLGTGSYAGIGSTAGSCGVSYNLTGAGSISAYSGAANGCGSNHTNGFGIKLINATTNVYRIWMTVIATSTTLQCAYGVATQNTFAGSFYPNATSGTINYALAQLELDNGTHTPSSYIPNTTASPIVRSADSLTVLSSTTTGPSIVESQNIATGFISRTAFAAGSFVWPTTAWVRAMAVYPSGTPLAYLNNHLTPGSRF